MWIVFTYIWLPFMILPSRRRSSASPTRYLEASRDLGARGWTTFRRVVLPLALPGIVAGSIFTFSLTLGDYITPTLVGGAGSEFIGNVVYRNVGIANNVPFAAAFATVPLVVMGVYLRWRAAPARSRRCERRAARHADRARRLDGRLILLFLFVPIALIVLYAFNPSNIQSWPLAGLLARSGSAQPGTTRRSRDALVAVAEGGAARDGDRARARARWPRSRSTASASSAATRSRSLLVLPLALPGIITGMALNSFFHVLRASTSRYWTIVIGHATFCIVVVYNNVSRACAGRRPR